ncbi:MAG: DNA-processing protein DprA, partial [Pseudomonadota bacterium]
ADREIDAGLKAGARLLIHGEDAYPPLIAMIDAPPPVVWIKGDVKVFERDSLAVVGARNASALGIRTVRRLVSELRETGIVIVSGLARGIDATAHEASVATGTIAVMAGGVDQVYPQENSELAERITDSGALLSDCPIGVEPTSRHFPRRNRLISGLARGVLLVEAAVRSGSLITARHALDQGRDVMACPGSPEDPRSGGCNALIREGATLVRSAEDILETLANPIQSGFAEPGSPFLFDGGDFDDDGFDGMDTFDDEDTGLDENALTDQVLSLLGPHPVDIDEIARQCGATPSDMSLVMLELDLAGQIDLLPGGMVSRAGNAA